MAVIRSGSGGGGGGGMVWHPLDGSGPAAVEENGELTYQFADTLTQKLRVFMKVPTSYSAGSLIKLKVAQYSPGVSSGTMLFTTTATLIRVAIDAVSSVTNQRVSTNTAITVSATANRYEEAICDLTDATGHINAVAVSHGDIILIEITRNTAVDTDVNDIRFLPSATEVTFS
jgi:hypothetical protein